MINRVPTFNGKHNEVKSKCFLALAVYDKPMQIRKIQGMSVKGLARITRCNEKSISTMMASWVRWRFVTRHEVRRARGHSVYAYRLAIRGKRWLEKYIPYMPVKRYLADMQDLANIVSIYGHDL